ncbi:MAG TPA: hypothetical protein VFZ51_02500, partial [Woeseiaceae bacterium]
RQVSTPGERIPRQPRSQCARGALESAAGEPARCAGTATEQHTTCGAGAERQRARACTTRQPVGAAAGSRSATTPQFRHSSGPHFTRTLTATWVGAAISSFCRDGTTD